MTDEIDEFACCGGDGSHETFCDTYIFHRDKERVRRLRELTETTAAQAEEIETLKHEIDDVKTWAQGDWDGTNCELCGFPCLYGSRHVRCGTVLRTSEQRKAAIDALRKAASDVTLCTFCGALWGADEPCKNDCALHALLKTR